LTGKIPSLEVFRIAGGSALKDISPIDDLRASAEYREHAASVLVERALSMAWRQAESRYA
jgi:CO/xanthine dehydrogenase FAD-binding subunit